MYETLGNHEKVLEVYYRFLSEESKNSHRGAEILGKIIEIYEYQGKTQKMQKEAERLLFSYGTTVTAYLILKRSYGRAGWKAVKDGYIERLKHSFIYPDIMLEEDMIDELTEYIIEKGDYDIINKYQNYILPDHRDELLGCMVKAILQEAERYSGRAGYRELLSMLRNIIENYKAPDEAAAIREELIERHPRRRVMKEILYRLRI